MHAHTHTPTHGTHPRMHIRTRMHAYTHMHTCARAHAHTRAHTHTHTHFPFECCVCWSTEIWCVSWWDDIICYLPSLLPHCRLSAWVFWRYSMLLMALGVSILPIQVVLTNWLSTLWVCIHHISLLSLPLLLLVLLCLLFLHSQSILFQSDGIMTFIEAVHLLVIIVVSCKLISLQREDKNNVYSCLFIAYKAWLVIT